MKSIRMFSRISFLITLFSAFIIITSCSKSSGYTAPATNPSPGGGGVTQGANEVWIQNMAFGPSSKTVTVGTTITWTNKDNVGHNVTSTSGAFGSGTLGLNGTFSFTFSTAGTYNYSCTIHPTMTGTIIVQ